jgi:hypothetical protein
MLNFLLLSISQSPKTKACGRDKSLGFGALRDVLFLLVQIYFTRNNLFSFSHSVSYGYHLTFYYKVVFIQDINVVISVR